MNIRVIARLLSIISFVIAGCMCVALAWSLYFKFFGTGEVPAGDTFAIFLSIAITFSVGAVLFFCGENAREGVLRREGMAVVGLSWLLAAGLGALPYFLSGSVDNYADAFFESMSGFTTTGSSVFTAAEIDRLSGGIHFWRCFTQWLGGMGIVVLFVAIVPFLRTSGKQLLLTEVPGPTSESLEPRVRDTAMFLWAFYSTLSLILVLILWLEGMTFFDAVCHASTTLSTGGFSTHGASIGHFDSLAIEVTIIVFMIFAGVNFGLYYRVMRGDWKLLFTDPELRFYLFILALASTAIGVDLWLNYNQMPEDAIRDSSFQVASITTTTGYGSADFDAWPSFSRCVLVVLMFVGGCAGSTGGGMKVIRILVLIKHALIETERAFRPQTVRTLKVGRAVIEEQTIWTILAFFAIFMGTMVIGTLIMASMGLEPIPAMTAAAATLNNIGPGLGSVNPDFSVVPWSGKLVLSLLMVVGRLELFSILVLLSPGLWRGR